MTGKIDIQLMKLADGGRLLRFSEKTSGLCLEKNWRREKPWFAKRQDCSGSLNSCSRAKRWRLTDNKRRWKTT
jgi:hypothetical protein